MKTKLILASLIALTGLWACKREEAAPVNPTFDPVANTVNTSFVLAISPGTGNPDTKQTAVDVQASGANFRGLSQAHLLTYSLNYTGVGGAHYMYNNSDASSVAIRDFDLGNLATASDISEDDNRRILELALPLGTNTILMYGCAPKTGTADEQGSCTFSGVALGTTLDNVSFKINPRLEDEDAFSQFADLMGHMLTFIMGSGLINETTAIGYKSNRDNRYKFWWPVDETSATFALTDAADAHPGYTLHSGSITWKQLGDQYAADPNALSALQQILGEAYNQVMYLRKDGTKVELRAGAAVTIVRLVSDMFNIITRVMNTDGITPDEYVARLLATEIYTRAALFFHYDELSSKLNFRSRADIMDAVDLKFPGRSASYYTKVTDEFFYYSKTSSSDPRTEYLGFPMNLSLPSGSAIMSFVTKNEGQGDAEYIEVEYLTEIPTYGMGPGASGFPIKNYRYPAELLYYTNSSLRTSDEAVERTSYPAVAGNWASSEYWTSVWNGSSVSSTTRSVAVAKPINYGTAVLKAQFAFKDSEIEDNNKGVHPLESNNKVAVNVANKFLVSGIIIGGVDDTVGWNFLPKEGGSFNKMIYDNLGGNTFPIPPYTTDPDAKYSAPVYTCTWDNYNAALAPDAQQKVYIGLELINNSGEDLWAELNMIRNGGTFYLVGELDPTADGVADNLKKNDVIDLARSDMFYPPFDADGKTINAPRVFMQDYVTSVKFNFTKEALKHAYVTMPDLRAGQISLGLSVDLTWEKGLEFDVNMGEVTGN